MYVLYPDNDRAYVLIKVFCILSMLNKLPPGVCWRWGGGGGGGGATGLLNKEGGATGFLV